MDLSKVSRVTVVTDKGVVFEKYDTFKNGVVACLQDNGRTLKLFPRPKPMGNVVTKKGHADWDDLKGKRITFKWCDGYEDYYPDIVFHNTRPYAEDPRYPRYYIQDEDGGGYSVWEDEEVEVTVYV